MRCQSDRHFILILIILFGAYSALSRSDPSDSFIGDELNFEDILSDLPNRFSLETATAHSTASLPAFDTVSADAVIRYRNSLPYPADIIDDVDKIPGISPLQTMILSHLAGETQVPEYGNISGYIRNGFVHKPESESAADSKYYVKTGIETEHNIRITAVGERDPFEPRAFDLFSANVSLKFDSGATHVVLGDYRPSFGQHLVFSRYGRNYANGTDVIARNSAMVGNTLFDETLFLRGGYVSVKRGNLTAELFTSRRSLDATLDESGKAVTVRTGGYHITNSPRENLTETIHTIRTAFGDSRSYLFGIAGIISRYDPPLGKREDPRNVNDPKGANFGYVTIDGTVTAGLTTLFFEHAVSSDDEHASAAGIRVKNADTSGSVLFRNYTAGYHPLRSGGFSSFGSTTNERGIYTAFRTKLPHRSRVTVSMDLARTLSRTFTDPMPSSRRRLNVLFQTRITQLLSGRLIARSVTGSSEYNSRWSCRAQAERILSAGSRTGIRSSAAWSQSSGDGGMYADLQFFSYMERFKCSVTVGIFDIPGYDARFYRYEYDVPGRGYTRAVWGKGSAASLVLTGGPLSLGYRIADSDESTKTNEITLQTDYTF